MSFLFNVIKEAMQEALNDTVARKSMLKRIHTTIAAAVGFDNDCDSKTIITEAKHLLASNDKYHDWLKPICDEYEFLINNTLEDEEYEIISKLLKNIEEMTKTDDSDIHEEEDPVKLENTETAEIIEHVEDPNPKKCNWENIVEQDTRGEYIWITCEKIIPKNKYKLYRNGRIVNTLDNNQLTVSKKHRFTLSSTMCIAGDRTSSINKIRNLNYYTFIEYVENEYPEFLMPEIVKEAEKYKGNRKTKGNGVRNEDRTELSSMFTKKLHPIPEGGHYRQLDGKQFGLTGCYAINKYGHIVNRENKLVINSVDRKGVKYITIEGKEFEFNKLMLGAFRIDDPRTKAIEQEFLMRDTMIYIDWIEGIPSEKYIYIKGKGIYNRITETFIRITNSGGNEYFSFSSTMHKPYKQKGDLKIGHKKETVKRVKVTTQQFISVAEKRMKLRDNNDNNNDVT